MVADPFDRRLGEPIYPDKGVSTDTSMFVRQIDIDKSIKKINDPDFLTQSVNVSFNTINVSESPLRIIFTERLIDPDNFWDIALPTGLGGGGAGTKGALIVPIDSKYKIGIYKFWGQAIFSAINSGSLTFGILGGLVDPKDNPYPNSAKYIWEENQIATGKEMYFSIYKENFKFDAGDYIEQYAKATGIPKAAMRVSIQVVAINTGDKATKFSTMIFGFKKTGDVL